MASGTIPLTTQSTEGKKEIGELEPLEVNDLGVYASFDVSPEPMYGPKQLGPEFCAAIEQLSLAVTKSESAPRIFEVLQTWEARLFDRNYHFNISGAKGWGFFGGERGPQGVMAASNSKKLFSCNVYGARKDKITAALSREVPSILFTPKDPDWGPDQIMADESEKYTEVWKQDTDLEKVLVETAGYFYTDDRVLLWTASWADQQRWGTEQPEDEITFGDEEPEGITPENEVLGDAGANSQEDADESNGPEEVPAIAEITKVYGKLEHKVPLIADDEHEMGWARISHEINPNIAKERYVWIEDAIKAGSGLTTGNDQFDRLARMNVRLAVQNTTVSGESFVSDVTETHTWYRPSQYRQIKDKSLRDQFYINFPSGLRTTHCGTELAFVRNESMSDHIKILHSRHGSGQNRRAIGTNYLPLQKVLNANLSLLNKYFQACVPRRFGAVGPLDIDAINQQGNDPGAITGVLLGPGQTIDGITGVEKVPTPTTGLLDFIQWLVDGAPEAMDSATPAMFGTEDTDTFGATQLNRDQALQVFGTPWKEICWGLAGAAQQAAMCAARNRVADIRSKVPGAGRLTVELKKLKGEALAYPESVDLPETLMEQESRINQIMAGAPNIPLLMSIITDPRNLMEFKKIARFAGMTMPGVDSVQKQQSEFEELMKSGPVQNPQLVKLQQSLQSIVQEMQQDPDPNAQAQGQQMLQQVQQALQTLPPLVTSVPVAQDSSEDHAIESAITLAFMRSDEGRKLKNGTTQPDENGGPSQADIFKNIALHWQAHEQMKQKLQPVPPLPVKLGATVALDKLPPNVQAEALQAAGLDAKPEDFHEQDMLIPHEVTTEKEGVDEQGVPVKTKQSFVGPGKL